MRRFKYLFLFTFFTLIFTACNKNTDDFYKPTTEELDTQFYELWNLPEYDIANSAKNTGYLSDIEKRIYYYLNLARLNPKLFAETYVNAFNGTNGYPNHPEFRKYKKTLIQELTKMNSLQVLIPDSTLWEIANCHAIELGENGKTGHDRTGTDCPTGYQAESIAYGHYKALEICMQLLIDYGVPDLAHRKTCLGNYSKLGISMQTHISLDICTVLDFQK